MLFRDFRGRGPVSIPTPPMVALTEFFFHWTLSGATTLGQRRPESKGNEGVHRIPQSSNITEASTSDLFSVINRTLIGGILSLCRDAVGVFCSPKPTRPSVICLHTVKCKNGSISSNSV